MPTVHVVGAGLAGLACAVRLAGKGRRIIVYEAAPRAGGRCRSFYDDVIGRTVDNGNHLLLSANHAALGYLKDIGAGDSLTGPQSALFPFLDLVSGARWDLRPNEGLLHGGSCPRLGASRARGRATTYRRCGLSLPARERRSVNA